MMAEVGEYDGAGTGGGDSHDDDKHIQKHIVFTYYIYLCHFN
jgi:hypothetical protein